MGKHTYTITTLPEDAPREPETPPEPVEEVVDEQPTPDFLTLTPEALQELLENYAISIRREASRGNFEIIQNALHVILADEANKEDVDIVRAQLLQLLDETLDKLKNETDRAYAESEEAANSAFRAKYGATIEPVEEDLQPE